MVPGGRAPERFVPGAVAPDQDPASQPTPTRVATGEPTKIWTDDSPLSSDWDPPRWHDRFSFGTKALATLLVAVLAGIGLYAGGAFERASTVRTVDWRTPAVTGPIEITVQGATYEKSSFRTTINIHALCRYVYHTATRNQTLDVQQGVSARLMDGRQITYDNRYVSFGNPGGMARKELGPGTGPVPCRIQLTVPKDYQKAHSHVQLFIFQQRYSDSDAVQAGGPGWRVSRGGVTMGVPVVDTTTPKPGG